ncbi:MAG: sulfotransferase, partial [Pseudomonadota bacterium]
DHAKSVFIAHNEAVTAAIPTDRLLVYPVGSGWGPLCDFVGRPIPDQPFPSGNTARQFQERVARNLMPE